MLYYRFKTLFFPQICFGNEAISKAFPTFDKNNLTRWCHRGLLVKLRNGLYSFPEYLKHQEAIFYIANQLYPFAYITLHTALAYHNFVPNPPMMQVSSVSDRKTQDFKNGFGKFSYQRMKPALHFGYERISEGEITFLMATPEKALLDLFYLYPKYYDTEQSIRNFALEERTLYESLNVEMLYTYLGAFQNMALERRVSIFTRIYEL